MDTSAALVHDYEEVIFMLKSQIAALKTSLKASHPSDLPNREELLQTSRCQVRELASQMVTLAQGESTRPSTAKQHTATPSRDEEESSFRDSLPLLKKIHLLEAENHELKARITVLEREKTRAIEQLYGSGQRMEPSSATVEGNSKRLGSRNGMWAEVKKELGRGYSPGNTSIQQKIQALRSSVRSLSLYGATDLRKTPSVKPIPGKTSLKPPQNAPKYSQNPPKHSQSAAESRRNSLKSL
jgi:hypothetical protein